MRNPFFTTSSWISLAALTPLSLVHSENIVLLTAPQEDRGSKPDEVQHIEGYRSSFIVHEAAPQGHLRSPPLNLWIISAS